MARIGIDIDNVLYDFEGTFRQYVEDRLKVSLPAATHWHYYRKDWALTDEQFLTLMKEAILAHRLFWQGNTVETNTSKGVWDLMNEGHTIILATDREINGAEKEAREATRSWLQEMHIPYDQLVFTKDKTTVDCDVFLDDRPQAIPSLILAGIRGVYYTQAWNEKFPFERVSSIDEFVELVKDSYV